MWPLNKRHLLWAIGLTIIVLSLWFIGTWLWEVLSGYIRPKTSADKKDLVNVFVVIGAAVIGTLTAVAALGNLYISRRNLQNAQASLQQQRNIEEGRAQDEALQAYFEQMGDLLTNHKLMETVGNEHPLRLLAQAQTLTVLDRLDQSRKGHLLRFLRGAGLLNKDNPIVGLVGANLQGANLFEAKLAGAKLFAAVLTGADLRGADLFQADLANANLINADLRGAILDSADLNGAVLYEADLGGARLEDANLRGAVLSHAILRDSSLIQADLRGATLIRADFSGADLSIAKGVIQHVKQIQSLEGATMPDGQKYEEWRKSEDGRS